MAHTESSPHSRPSIFYSFLLATAVANLHGLLNSWNRSGPERELAFYLTLIAHFLLLVQYAVRFVGVGLLYRVDNTILGWVSSCFVALVSYIAANAVVAPDWWLGLYAALSLGAVVKDWELRNWAKRQTEKEGGLSETGLMRRFEDTAIAESILCVCFLILFVIVKTSLGANLGLDKKTAVALTAAFALVVTLVSLGVTLSRMRALATNDDARGTGKTGAPSPPDGSGHGK